MDGWMDGWVDRWVDRWMYVCNVCEYAYSFSIGTCGKSYENCKTSVKLKILKSYY